MQLFFKDKIYLVSCGYTITDLKQISRSCKKIKILMLKNDIAKRIRQGDFIKLFGREGFLNRLARATFHKSSFFYNEVEKIGYLFELEG